MSANSGSSGHGRYVTLDGMRAVAAIAVALLHFNADLMPQGSLAVDFFFVLSGFVLMKAYARRFADGMGVAAFMQARFRRLYPLFLSGSLIGAAWALLCYVLQTPLHLSPRFMAHAALFNFAMLPDPLAPVLFPFNLPAWSLFYELLANLALVAVLARLGTRMLSGVALLLLVLYLYTLSIPVPPSADPALVPGVGWDQPIIPLARTGFAFTVGVLIARLLPARPRNASLLAFLAIVAFLAILRLDLAVAVQAWFAPLFVVAIAPALVVLGARLEPPAWSARAAAFTGEMSFALYAIHYPIQQVFQAAMRQLGWTSPAFAAVYVAAVLFASWVLVRCVPPLAATIGLRWNGPTSVARGG
ncbi:acyltransferase family protein [Alteraurantiacibacter buctensis]|uniref:Acyltransferase family protein n=1 Tax=Alteraurantiacibacter buctensis TaxID=1503981 RepID=A0A844Z308_9SPHN|nr:acyltransferase [Alteraurantiacibacter buctensis]MXO72907.1 acyltransferase family protein [Alteraurantiacibacter buctensis]